MPKVVFPEGNNQLIQQAVKALQDLCTPILLTADPAANLTTATQMLQTGAVDTLVAGIDYPSRDVILAVRDHIGVAGAPRSTSEKPTFSSLFVAKLPDGRTYILADGATCKNPTAEQLADIIVLTHAAALKILAEPPKIAILSFSTFGSGGKDPSMDKTAQTLKILARTHPDILVDGEMQLDAATNPRIAAKKSTTSKVAGHANVLITPDINSGNILYKSLEQFAAATIAGPILLGFKKPCSDLSRGSTVEDIILTTQSLLKLLNEEEL